MKVNALEYICERIVDSQDFNKKYDDLVRISSNLIFFNTKNNSNFVLNIEDQNKILKYCDFLSNSDKANNRNLALKIVALIDEVAVDNNYKELIKKSVLNKFGLFSASDAFSSENIEISASTTIISELRKINQSIAGTNEIYTNNQYDLYNEIINKK
ncbi:hypothetical protein AbaMCR8683_18915 [Acinetobacter baumannii]|nr:hypothetical protein [Acinetobacter baumannii]PPC50646.1 hypothetical protein AbaMCR8683_18915 [Acinetobacter baumannii]